ncbi:MAG: EcsC family protein [Ignavibacteriales bacterium]|nr:MAG: EcsC family protein [Ignavibacteriales bacterium]
MEFKEEDLNALERAVDTLENPSLTAKITDFIGTPIEKAFKYLPEKWNEKIGEVTQLALRKALKLSIMSVNRNYTGESSNKLHKILSGASGAVGGAFGFVALSVELPVSTTIILRSIADIARSEGEDLSDIEVQLSCLEVFALGGRSEKDDSSESGYFTVRIGLSQSLNEAAKYIIKKGLSDEGTPIFFKFIIKIASRFGIQVSEKAAAQAIPVIGAAGGAIINLLFIDHFQNVARGHFTVRRLEKIYGKEIVKQEYERILKLVKS